MTVTSDEYYHFIRARAESETTAYRPGMYEKREEEHGWMVDLYQYWNVHDSASREMLARRYIERFVGCVENLTNPKCDMNYREKRMQVKKMLAKKRVIQTLRLAKPHSIYMKVLLIPIRWKNVTLTLLEAQVITWVKSRNAKLFSKLKAGR